MHISWTRLASFCHLGFISDPLIVSKFHNETHDPKGQENKIYTIVKGRETFYRRHTVPVTSCSEVKYVLKRVSFGSKDCTKEPGIFFAILGRGPRAFQIGKISAVNHYFGKFSKQTRTAFLVSLKTKLAITHTIAIKLKENRMQF